MELQFYIAWPQKMSLIRLHFSGNFEKRKNKPGKQKVIPSRAKEQVLKLQGKNRLPWWLSGKESACSVGDMGSIPGLGRSNIRGNANPLQCSCLGNPMDRVAQRALQSMGPARVRQSLATEQTEGEEQELGLSTERQRSWQVWLK